MHVHDERDREIVEPDLVAAIRDLNSWVFVRSRHWRARAASPNYPARHLVDPDRLARRAVVAGAQRFAEVFRRYAHPGAFTITDSMRQWGESFREEQLAKRDAGDSSA